MGHSNKDCISILLTTKCNLACDYCYLTSCNLEGISIDIDFAKEGVRDYFSNSASRHIRFFGAGEPTLEMGMIKELKDFAYKLSGEKLVAEIQTNGVFNSQIANWLAENMNIVWISHDGIPDAHDLLRKTKGGQPTSNIIERNILIMLKKNPSLQIGIRATITNLNIYRQTEIIDYFDGLGIKAIYSDPVFPPVEENTNSIHKIEIPTDFMLEYAKEYLKAYKFAEKKGIFYGSILTVNFDQPSELFCRSCLPAPHLTPDGFVTNCDMAFSGQVLPDLIYGYYDRSTKKIIYDEEKVRRIRMRRASNLRQCANCEVLLNCAGGCFGEGLNETGSLLGVKQDYCDAIRFLAKNLPLNQKPYPYHHP
jgi:radical SAM protein with 4Fe4S-binding SPASM domain